MTGHMKERCCIWDSPIILNVRFYDLYWLGAAKEVDF